QLLARRGTPVTGAELFYAIQTALGLSWHSALLAERHARWRPRTSQSLFPWRWPLQGGAWRACHALDLPFTFGTLEAPGMAEFAGSGAEAEALSENLRAAWVALRPTRDPH